MRVICLDNSFGFENKLTIGRLYKINFLKNNIYDTDPGQDGEVIDDNNSNIIFRRPLLYGRFAEISTSEYREKQLDLVLK